jgi:hypothetical protein
MIENHNTATNQQINDNNDNNNNNNNNNNNRTIMNIPYVQYVLYTQQQLKLLNYDTVPGTTYCMI